MGQKGHIPPSGSITVIVIYSVIYTKCICNVMFSDKSPATAKLLCERREGDLYKLCHLYNELLIKPLEYMPKYHATLQSCRVSTCHAQQ